MEVIGEKSEYTPKTVAQFVKRKSVKLNIDETIPLIPKAGIIYHKIYPPEARAYTAYIYHHQALRFSCFTHAVKYGNAKS